MTLNYVTPLAGQTPPRGTKMFDHGFSLIYADNTDPNPRESAKICG
jgi:hypothetical protein